MVVGCCAALFLQLIFAVLLVIGGDDGFLSFLIETFCCV